MKSSDSWAMRCVVDATWYVRTYVHTYCMYVRRRTTYEVTYSADDRVLKGPVTYYEDGCFDRKDTLFYSLVVSLDRWLCTYSGLNRQVHTNIRIS